jgi:c-di-GMP-binding flagellar brake protein YcgR
VESEAPQLNKTGAERRLYRRIKLVTNVQCEALNRSEVMVTRDLSVGGMFLIAHSPFPVGSELLLTFRLDLTGPAITTHARVMYSHAGVGMGTQFLGLNDETRKILQDFVDAVA